VLARRSFVVHQLLAFLRREPDTSGATVLPMSDQLDVIRAHARAENVYVTQHAQRAMDEEEISLDEVLEAITTAVVLEDYPNHRRGACCLLYGLTTANRALHVVCTTGRLSLIIITVYEPRPPKWQTPTERNMKCSVENCLGEYEPREVVHTVHHGQHILVIDHVPALVCDRCGDVLLTPETVRRIELLRRGAGTPTGTVPLYDFAKTA
jgi:YgiT-type zinc finger domain-containing protein